MIYWLVCGIGLIVGIALLVYGLRLKSQPNFVMVDCQVKQDIDKKNKRLLVNAQAVFVNTGQGTAYQVQARRVYASMEMPTQAEVQPALLQPNPIKVGGKIVVPFIASQPLIRSANVSSCLLIYCGLGYSDSPSGGKQFEDEQWLAYPVNAGAIAFMKPEQKETFEPFVRKAYSQ